MMDQAKAIRKLMSSCTTSTSNSKKTKARVITISSGKGGVGKTNFSVNLAIYLARQSQNVIIIDADFGLANIEVLLDITPRYNFYHLIKERKKISDIITNTKLGIKFISAGNGFNNITDITTMELKYFIEQFANLDELADIIIIDTGAGISKNVTSFINDTNETIILTTPEPTSFTDAYTLIKVIKEKNKNIDNINIVINKAENRLESMKVFNKLQNVSKNFLNLNLKNLGYIPSDNNLIKSVKKQKPAIINFPNSDFSKSIESIGSKLLNTEDFKNDGIKLFMKKFINIFEK